MPHDARAEVLPASFTPSLMEAMRENVRQSWLNPFFRMERGYLVPAPEEVTWRDIAYRKNRGGDHHGSFWQNERRFDIFLLWDGRARIECDGVVIFRFGPGAADVFRGIENRSRARAGTNNPGLPGSEP